MRTDWWTYHVPRTYTSSTMSRHCSAKTKTGLGECSEHDTESSQVTYWLSAAGNFIGSVLIFWKRWCMLPRGVCLSYNRIWTKLSFGSTNLHVMTQSINNNFALPLDDIINSEGLHRYPYPINYTVDTQCRASSLQLCSISPRQSHRQQLWCDVCTHLSGVTSTLTRLGKLSHTELINVDVGGGGEKITEPKMMHSPYLLMLASTYLLTVTWCK